MQMAEGLEGAGKGEGRGMHLVGCKTLGSRGQQEGTRPAEDGG